MSADNNYSSPLVPPPVTIEVAESAMARSQPWSVALTSPRGDLSWRAQGSGRFESIDVVTGFLGVRGDRLKMAWAEVQHEVETKLDQGWTYTAAVSEREYDSWVDENCLWWPYSLITCYRRNPQGDYDCYANDGSLVGTFPEGGICQLRLRRRPEVVCLDDPKPWGPQ